MDSHSSARGEADGRRRAGDAAGGVAADPVRAARGRVRGEPRSDGGRAGRLFLFAVAAGAGSAEPVALDDRIDRALGRESALVEAEFLHEEGGAGGAAGGGEERADGAGVPWQP